MIVSYCWDLVKNSFRVQTQIKNCDVNVDNTRISNITETRNMSKYLVACLDDVIRLLLILPKMSEYAKNFKDKDWDKAKNKNNKSLFFCIDNVSQLKKEKVIWTKN